MPELPEVETILLEMKAKLLGKRVVAMECLRKGTVIYDEGCRQPIFPAIVNQLSRRGKYIIMETENGNCLIIHLRMTGKLIYDEVSGFESRHIRARLLLQDKQRIVFDDVRTFGKIIVCPDDKLENWLPNLGVEPLSDAFNPTYLEGKLAKKLAPVKTVLLDQSIIAGLGNIYASEILYRCGINPVLPAKSLSIGKLRFLVKHTREVLREAIELSGTSISDFRRLDDKKGEFQDFLRVYQRQTCPQGHPIKKIVQAGRSTYFCPVCQKLPELIIENPADIKFDDVK